MRFIFFSVRMTGLAVHSSGSVGRITGYMAFNAAVIDRCPFINGTGIIEMKFAIENLNCFNSGIGGQAAASFGSFF